MLLFRGPFSTQHLKDMGRMYSPHTPFLFQQPTSTSVVYHAHWAWTAVSTIPSSRELHLGDSLRPCKQHRQMRLGGSGMTNDLLAYPPLPASDMGTQYGEGVVERLGRINLICPRPLTTYTPQSSTTYQRHEQRSRLFPIVEDYPLVTCSDLRWDGARAAYTPHLISVLGTQRRKSVAQQLGAQLSISSAYTSATHHFLHPSFASTLSSIFRPLVVQHLSSTVSTISSSRELRFNNSQWPATATQQTTPLDDAVTWRQRVIHAASGLRYVARHGGECRGGVLTSGVMHRCHDVVHRHLAPQSSALQSSKIHHGHEQRPRLRPAVEQYSLATCSGLRRYRWRLGWISEYTECRSGLCVTEGHIRYLQPLISASTRREHREASSSPHPLSSTYSPLRDIYTLAAFGVGKRWNEEETHRAWTNEHAPLMPVSFLSVGGVFACRVGWDSKSHFDLQGWPTGLDLSLARTSRQSTLGLMPSLHSYDRQPHPGPTPSLSAAAAAYFAVASGDLDVQTTSLEKIAVSNPKWRATRLKNSRTVEGDITVSQSGPA
ncbi:hypothetical protein CPB84DRAFT_1848727 [Gymnopilus junonius]|uniref:Uncharacterized protein n=1 Tax=Gymnopilus junonius TaxID=109634 RepID=A0A9P5TM69_GYMJU|nr:hypothetical protein CPB84DRAFT_1848727 [Gymnopilus junonius]